MPSFFAGRNEVSPECVPAAMMYKMKYIRFEGCGITNAGPFQKEKAPRLLWCYGLFQLARAAGRQIIPFREL